MIQPLPAALGSLGVCAAYFALRNRFPQFDLPPASSVACFLGVTGAIMIARDVCIRIDRRLNRYPPPPCFAIDKTGEGWLALDSDGTYESCQRFLNTLRIHFDAECSVHLESGPTTGTDKNQGFWNVRMFGQDFFVMRDRGFGLWISGPKPSADLAGFLRVAAHFKAVEFHAWQSKLRRCFGGENRPESLRLRGGQ